MARKNPTIDLLPQILDLALYAGDGANLRLTIKDAAGQPVDASGALTAQIKNTRSDTTALTEFNADMTNAATGIVLISLDGSQTSGLITNGSNQFSGVWDVQWLPSGGQPITIIQGTVSCVLDVTRP